MAVHAWQLFLVLEGLGISALDHSQAVAKDQHIEALQLSPSGKVMRAEKRNHERSVMRREDSTEADLDEVALTEMQQRFYGVIGVDRDDKIVKGTAFDHKRGDPWAITSGTNAESYGSTVGGVGGSGRGVPLKSANYNDAPAWATHASIPSMPECTQDVTLEMGLSDYGSVSHSCSACQLNCTEENKQQAANVSFLFEPPLSTCNAFDVKAYANWSDINQLGCSDCEGKGLRHMFQFAFATNAGEGVTGYEDKELGFEGWMGPEVIGGPRGSGSDFMGRHVFEVADTEEPSHSDNCDAVNPPGRWLAIPGEIRAGETFTCKRICKESHPCKCGRNTHMRCSAGIAMASSQIFSYRLRSIAESATGSLGGNSYVGTEWEVTAEDLTQTSPVMVVGRVILAGNAAIYGIKSLRQSHQHLGCVPCDLFYESTITAGPFIMDPVGVHALRSADGIPPALTSESCELFRISAIGGYTVKFETGPGLWPPFQVNDTIFTCSHSGENTCPA
jgi:hypothetical protein